jgi:hypothetical protein
MSEKIEYSIFSNNFKNEKVFSSDKLGDITFKWNIEKVSQLKILRFQIDNLTEIFEVEYDTILNEAHYNNLNEYFLDVIQMLVHQVEYLKEGEYSEVIDEEDIQFLKHFENKYDIKHTQGDFK